MKREAPVYQLLYRTERRGFFGLGQKGFLNKIICKLRKQEKNRVNKSKKENIIKNIMLKQLAKLPLFQ